MGLCSVVTEPALVENESTTCEFWDAVPPDEAARVWPPLSSLLADDEVYEVNKMLMKHHIRNTI